MKTSAAGVKALILREGLRLRAYPDERGIWTIGVGHTAAAGLPHPQAGMIVTEASATALLAADLKQYEDAVNAVRFAYTQGEFDACVSLCYNIGVHGFTGSTVAHMLAQGNIRGAADAFLMWEEPASLKSRREGERLQFLGVS